MWAMAEVFWQSKGIWGRRNMLPLQMGCNRPILRYTWVWSPERNRHDSGLNLKTIPFGARKSRSDAAVLIHEISFILTSFFSSTYKLCTEFKPATSRRNYRHESSRVWRWPEVSVVYLMGGVAVESWCHRRSRGKSRHMADTYACSWRYTSRRREQYPLVYHMGYEAVRGRKLRHMDHLSLTWRVIYQLKEHTRS